MLSACRDDVKVNKMIKKVNDNSGMPRVYLFTLDSLKSNLKVNVFTKDSVVAEITIQNNSSEPIAFLNKMLPSDTLTESIFHLSVKSITNESINLYPRPIKSKNSYYQGLQFLAPAVIPNIELDSFVSISPNKKCFLKLTLPNYTT
jgi:DNA phosphorothioation-dependent restriction protein DptG